MPSRPTPIAVCVAATMSTQVKICRRREELDRLRYVRVTMVLVDCAGRLDREKQTTIVAKSSFCTLPSEIYAGILRRTGCTSKKKEVLFADCFPSEDASRSWRPTRPAGLTGMETGRSAFQTRCAVTVRKDLYDWVSIMKSCCGAARKPHETP